VVKVKQQNNNICLSTNLELIFTKSCCEHSLKTSASKMGRALWSTHRFLWSVVVILMILYHTHNYWIYSVYIMPCTSLRKKNTKNKQYSCHWSCPIMRTPRCLCKFSVNWIVLFYTTSSFV